MKITTTICATSAAASALALDSHGSPTMTKHQLTVQMASCIRIRMSASKTIWYNEAEKACKDQIERQYGNSASGALVASDVAAKP